MKLITILILSIGLVQSKTFEDAYVEYVALLRKIGTGICPMWKFETLAKDAKICLETLGSQVDLRSHHCDVLERAAECQHHFDECYTPEKLEKLKAASMEAIVQLIGTFDDDTEDMLQDCPIYTEIVGMRNSTKMMYIGISVGVIVILAVMTFLLYKRYNRPRYNQAATA